MNWINIEGRLDFDMFKIICQEFKQKYLKLNTVARNLLGLEKEGVEYEEFHGL